MSILMSVENWHQQHDSFANGSVAGTDSSNGSVAASEVDLVCLVSSWLTVCVRPRVWLGKRNCKPPTRQLRTVDYFSGAMTGAAGTRAEV